MMDLGRGLGEEEVEETAARIVKKYINLFYKKNSYLHFADKDSKSEGS